MQLFVLGMHRSGTSAVTSLIEGMGAYTGPASQGIGANDENPKGFFERRDVIDLNASILAASGADWHRVHGFDIAAIAPAFWVAAAGIVSLLAAIFLVRETAFEPLE